MAIIIIIIIIIIAIVVIFHLRMKRPGTFFFVDPGGPVIIILASGSKVRGFDPGQGPWIFSERKNPGYDFLRKESKAVGPVS